MAARRLLVIGGNGALGRNVIETFTKSGWAACNIDIVENSNIQNNVIWPKHIGFSNAVNYLDEELARQDHFDCIVCTAGGFAMGKPGESENLTNIELMQKYCLETAFATSHLAARRLNSNGLTVLTGAAAVVGNSPLTFAYGYGAIKAATHNIIASLAEEMKDKSTTCGILPVTIDTPGNRVAMPEADFSSWTPCQAFSDQILVWTENTPANGGLYTFQTKNYQTSVVLSNA